MKKLYYLSASSFTQVDLGILSQLSKKYEVIYSLVITAQNTNVSLPALVEYCKVNNIKFQPFYFSARQRDIKIGFSFLKILKNIKQEKPDIIYTISHDIPILSLLCTLLKRNKTVVAIHDVEFHSDSKFIFFLKMARAITMSHFKHFHVFSKYQEMKFKTKYPTKKLYTIPLTLTDFGKLNNIENNYALAKTKFTRFLFFGNVLPYKGLNYLITAANNLSHKYSNFELIIAGRCDNWDTAYKPFIKKGNQIKQMIRHIKDEEIPALFAKSHYLVLPYKDATQSGPLMIAYNYNVPVIASNIAAFKDIVEEGTSGYFFKTENVEHLEYIMEKVINQSQDDYNKLLVKLERYVDTNFSADTISEKYESMFAVFE